MAIAAERDEEITRYYLRHAERLWRSISKRTRGLDDAIIDDACAFAWETLLRRPDVDLERYEAYWWLYKVALHQAWALGRAQRRELASGGLNGADEDGLEPIDLNSDVAELVADHLELATEHGVLGQLHWRERRELLLCAYGFSYQEIAKLTGTSHTAVNRWLARGRKALRARARDELSGDADRPAQ
jgi:DNA-directed RNA polymerase specialized sigma24 family protein